jgi:methionyl-tRNA formyltransferase
VIPTAPWRVAIITFVPRIALGYAAIVQSLGHEPAVVITPRWHGAGERPHPFADAFVAEAPPELDVVFPTSKHSLPRILRAYDVDLGLCTALPWLLTAETISTPPLGIVNGHPSLLPRYRGPFPIAWAVRNGEREIGMTYHLMDESFDTGNVLAQTSVPLGDDETEEQVYENLREVAPGLLATVFERLAAGDQGDVQEGGEYQSFFGDDYVPVDTSQTAAEVHRQVRAWTFVPPRLARGPVLGDIRLVKTSLTEVDGAERLECADGPLWIVESEPAPLTPSL